MADEATADGGGSATKITPELIQKVTDKVYALLAQDLQYERERNRMNPQWKHKKRC